MVYGNEEHKQRVNLSSLARSVLESDRAMFGDRLTLSGFLNRIIASFSETAEASIDRALEERRHTLYAALKSQEDSAQKEALVETLVEAYRQELQAKKEAYPQGESVIFRLNNDNFERLYDEQEEADNYKSPSKYLKALLEEYARLSPSERERVYFTPLLDSVVNTAVDAGYALDVKVGAADFTVRPYAVLSDEFGAHLYLVGMSRPKERSDMEERIVSLRISRLGKAKIRKHSKKLTDDDKRGIEKKLREVGVQFLVGDAEEIRVRLTPQGEAVFRQVSHMRPRPEAIEEGAVYRFSCTTRQIKNYFISFGKEAEVLSPESLREEFRQHFCDAANTYQ